MFAPAVKLERAEGRSCVGAATQPEESGGYRSAPPPPPARETNWMAEIEHNFAET